MNQALTPTINPDHLTSSGNQDIRNTVTANTLRIIELDTQELLEMMLKPKRFLDGDVTGKRTRMELLRKLSPEELLDIYYEYIKIIEALPYIPHDVLLMVGILESAISELQEVGIIISNSEKEYITEGRSDYLPERGRVEMSEGCRYLPYYFISDIGYIDYFRKNPLKGRGIIQSLSEKGKLALYRRLYDEIISENEYSQKDADDYWQIIQLLLSTLKKGVKNHSNSLRKGKIFYGKRGENIISTKYTIVYF